MPEKKSESLDRLPLIQALQEADLPLGKMTEIDGGDRVFYVIAVAKENISSLDYQQQGKSELTEIRQNTASATVEKIDTDSLLKFTSDLHAITDQLPWMNKEVSSFDESLRILRDKIFVSDLDLAYECLKNVMERLDAIMLAFDLGENYLPLLQKDRKLKLGPEDKPFNDRRKTLKGQDFIKLLNRGFETCINEICRQRKLSWSLRIISDGSDLFSLKKEMVNQKFWEFKCWSYNEKPLLILSRPWALMNEALTKTFKEAKGKYT